MSTHNTDKCIVVFTLRAHCVLDMCAFTGIRKERVGVQIENMRGLHERASRLASHGTVSEAFEKCVRKDRGGT